jgi:hypothetical protein
MDSKFRAFILELSKDECIKFLKQQKISLGKKKAGLIYDFLTTHPENEPIKIKGVSETTLSKLNLVELVRENKPEIKVDLKDIFAQAFSYKHELSLKEIYSRISKIVGGETINLRTGSPYKLKNGELLDPVVAKKRQQGFIRSFLEEHSSDSRQHYVRGNEVFPKGIKPNIFSNDNLRIRNEFINWRIQVDNTKQLLKECTTKKSGVWKMCPGKGKPTQDDFIGMEAECKPRTKGFRNQALGTLKENVVFTTQLIKTKM